MEMQLKYSYAKQLVNKIKSLLTEKCYGCQVSHPSQIHHDVCLMMTTEEQITLTYDEAVNRMNDDGYSLYWWDELIRVMHPYINDRHYMTEAWRDRIMTDKIQWESDVKKLVQTLIDN